MVGVGVGVWFRITRDFKGGVMGWALVRLWARAPIVLGFRVRIRVGAIVFVSVSSPNLAW